MHRHEFGTLEQAKAFADLQRLSGHKTEIQQTGGVFVVVVWEVADV